MRKTLYLDKLDIKHGNDKEEFLFTLESLAAKKAVADLVRKTYKKYEPPKDKTKKPDNKSTKDKSDDGKSGYKSDGGKSGGKPRYKSGGKPRYKSVVHLQPLLKRATGFRDL
ncbi:hypothetical protein KI688_004473 [Linnemannia hyalina]|uniref:Uncharacterized protein n=1 Tax=Linnemannia hyalina TaxID=64524 RepID=A0A9P7XN70_9FUNG|nr:hypothetical protein KI688_004473 [Linnemannia hyalina]